MGKLELETYFVRSKFIFIIKNGVQAKFPTSIFDYLRETK